MLVSNCCGAPPLTETYENMGKCRKCKDGAIFEEEEESPLSTGFKHKDLKKEREKEHGSNR